MKFKSYIQRFIAASLLLVFILASTPKRFLHSIFADHKDVAWVKSSDKQQQSLSNQNYQCQIDNLVVELPFFDSTNFIVYTSIQHNEQFKCHFVFDIIDYKHSVDFLRGPPIYC